MILVRRSSGPFSPFAIQDMARVPVVPVHNWIFEVVARSALPGQLGPRDISDALAKRLAERAKPYAGLAVKSWHHPLAATGSSTTLHDAGATNWTQPEHCWPSFGVS